MEDQYPLNNYREDFTLAVEGTNLEGFVSKSGVVNLLNIPFGKVPLRFRPATPVFLSDLDKTYNATQYGPKAPQPPAPGDIFDSIGHLYEKVMIPQPLDESACLNLNIYASPEAVTRGGKLPVFVWIHGGAFIGGDNGTMFDGNHLVKRSIELGKPMIVVTTTYRLNFFGFFTSKEIIDEAKGMGEVPVLNPGLHDQRLALQWVQKSIHHFGGDPSLVTVAGESAGAASILCHLQAGVPLFRQALMESPPALTLRTVETTQKIFDKIVDSIGIRSDAKDAEKLKAVRALPIAQLLSHFDGKFPTPVEDPNWFQNFDSNTAKIPKYWSNFPSWCRRIILGNCKDEAAIFLGSIPDLGPQHARGFVSRELGRPDISFPFDMEKKYSRAELITWASDNTFIWFTQEVALTASTQHEKPVYLYMISAKDPYSKKLNGFAYHSFGLPFTFNQPGPRINPELSIMEDNITSAFISFVHGSEPWEDFRHSGRLMDWDGSKAEMVDANIR